MRAGRTASTRVSGRTPLAPLPASSLKRVGEINGRTSAEPETSPSEVCSFQLPLTAGGWAACHDDSWCW